MRIRLTVGIDDAIAVEVVVGCRETSIVATIGPDGLACNLALATKTLVDEVPNVATLIVGGAANQIPVFLEATTRVTHGVGVLTLNEWACIAFLAISLAMSIIGIHWAVNVCLAPTACLLILTWARGVVSLHKVIGILKVLAVASFVAERPDNDGRMILQYIYIMALTLNVHIVETCILRKRLFAIAHSVTLNVGLSCDVNAILVTEFVPTWIVRIVAGAHSIYVELLHHLNVLNHTFHTHHITAVWVKFVAVNTLDEDGLSVDEQLLVLDFHLAETDALWDALKKFVAVVKRNVEIVEVRNLCRPCLDVCQLPSLIVESDGAIVKSCHRLTEHFLAFGICKAHLHGLSLTIHKVNLASQHTILVVVHEVGGDEEVFDVCLRTCIEIALTSNTTEAPEVLVLVPRAITPAHNLHGDEILLAWSNVLGDVELCCYL